jgi:single-strand DNA-binding protein
MANKVIMLGNITRDIELSYTNSGMAIANFGIALNNRRKTQNGYEDKAVFVDVKAFGKTGEAIANHFSKGSKIYIEGKLELDQWTDQAGNKRSKLYVIADNFEFVLPKAQNGQQPAPLPRQQPPQQYAQPQQQYAQPQQQATQQQVPEIDVDADIPF